MKNNAIITYKDEKIYTMCEKADMTRKRLGADDAEIILRCNGKAAMWMLRNFTEVGINGMKLEVEFLANKNPIVITFLGVRSVEIKSDFATKGTVRVDCRAANWTIKEGTLEDLERLVREQVVFT